MGAVVSASVWINGLAFVPYALLEARGRPDLTAKFHMIEILPHIVLLWICLHRFGLIGGAWALVFVSALDAALLFWKSDLRVHLLGSFWQGIGWVALAFVLAPAYATLHAGFCALALMVLLGVSLWGLRTSADVAAFLQAGLRRLRGWTLAVIMKVQRRA